MLPESNICWFIPASITMIKCPGRFLRPWTFRMRISTWTLGPEAMPEEVNRLVTDRLSDLLLTPDLLSSENLRKKGVAEDMPLFWPVHPRARQKMEEFGLWQRALACPGLVLLEPLGYHDMLRLNMDARIMLTDSGGLQEECTVLGTPCLTLRWNTERPVTLREHGGASVLVGNNVDRIREKYKNTLSSERRPVRPELWDGKAAERCLKAILDH
jgi:UDP-N-acetylglucosamine 2-epimerase